MKLVLAVSLICFIIYHVAASPDRGGYRGGTGLGQEHQGLQGGSDSSDYDNHGPPSGGQQGVQSIRLCGRNRGGRRGGYRNGRGGRGNNEGGGNNTGGGGNQGAGEAES